jgi:hypothetical protein
VQHIPKEGVALLGRTIHQLIRLSNRDRALEPRVLCCPELVEQPGEAEPTYRVNAFIKHFWHYVRVRCWKGVVAPKTHGILESSLYVSDVSRSVRFYEETFGFRVRGGVQA